MNVIVDGIEIKLTKAQVYKIKSEKTRREKENNTFKKCLRHFGFKKSKEVENGFYHKKNDWWAEIQDYGNFKTVWILGKGLKSSRSIPGGWVYNSTKEIIEELTKNN